MDKKIAFIEVNGEKFVKESPVNSNSYLTDEERDILAQAKENYFAVKELRKRVAALERVAEAAKKLFDPCGSTWDRNPLRQALWELAEIENRPSLAACTCPYKDDKHDMDCPEAYK